jgi:CRP-like cAMP-binding protein
MYRSRCPDRLDEEPWCRECPLRDLPNFDPIDEGELEYVEKPGAERNAECGRLLIRAGIPLTRLYSLSSGRVLRFDVLPNGREVILQLHYPGDIIGYGAALLGLAPHYSVRALTAVSYRVLDPKRVVALFTTAPELAHKLTLHLARRDRTVDYRLLNLGWRTAEEQVAAMLLFSYARLRRLGLLKDHAFNLPLSQPKIANFLGVHVTYVNRIMRRLREAGLATVQNGHVQINDMHGLLQLGCFCAIPKVSQRAASQRWSAGEHLASGERMARSLDPLTGKGLSNR